MDYRPEALDVARRYGWVDEDGNLLTRSGYNLLRTLYAEDLKPTRERYAAYAGRRDKAVALRETLLDLLINAYELVERNR